VFLFLLLLCSLKVSAHPLGNFTINHFSRIEVSGSRIKVRYVIDIAEIPAFQELQSMTAGLDEYVGRVSTAYADGLFLTCDGQRVALKTLSRKVDQPPGAGGLPTLRIECEFGGVAPETGNSVRRMEFEDRNFSDRIGWREIVVTPVNGTQIFNSSAYGSSVTDELRTYPGALLNAPPDERKASFSFTSGVAPAGSKPLLNRNGVAVVAVSRDRLSDLISVPELTPGIALLGCLVAILLGGLHALSPGHGKAIVGAYLIGSRGTAKDAAFLGLTVTVTHTAGVFALGAVTLLASEYIVPERLYPILSICSGALVVFIGMNLLFRRLQRVVPHAHVHNHSHGGKLHSHLPPRSITWKSLLAIGVSGGMLPCPSALVVLLAAIALHRVGYGLLLVVAFSVGLAGVLTIVGIAFVYLRGLVKRAPRLDRLGSLEKSIPVLSSLVITAAGLAICYQALVQAGVNFSTLIAVPSEGGLSLASAGGLGVLGLGLVYGLKHATEADHIVAVSTIVSEHRKLGRAALVGAMWGVGHTASLLLVGAGVLALRIAIPEIVSSWLEFGVALMIILLGAIAIRRALRSRVDVHVHKHSHDGVQHTHVHFHSHETEHGLAPEQQSHSHAIARVGLKPVVVGAMHGLAGSAALTLLVLTQINSTLLGMLYLAVFGVGSIAGMLLMSGLLGLPFVLSSRSLSAFHYKLQLIAGALSIAFGIWYAYDTGIATGLIRGMAV
jgi:ABC-type nickel/cobalt efflux system permease component RcnA